MAFFLVALPVAVFAALRHRPAAAARGARSGRWPSPLGVLGGLALLGVVGVLQAVATVLAGPEQAARVAANAPALQAGALRLLVVVLVGGGVLWAVWRGRLRGRRRAAAALAVVVIGRSLEHRPAVLRVPRARRPSSSATTR